MLSHFNWTLPLRTHENETENVTHKVIQYGALLAIFSRWSFQQLATNRKHLQGKQQGSFLRLTFLLRRPGGN